ncbi:c-type cytochrome [Ferruginivarius sediminum]|nr:cytochrome c [Ferruginivarius sediminum]
MKAKLVAVASVLSILSASAVAIAAEPKDAVEYRQAVMASLGGHAGAISRIVKQQVDYDHIAQHAEAIAATAPLVEDIWPDNSKPGDYEKTDALAKIWDEPDAFQEKVDKLKVEAEDFLAVAKGGDQGEVIAAFKELGQSCGGCHDDYRAE